MDDYSHAAEQMKESIISDYLEKHPDVKRHEVLTKMVNGRYVVGTIHEVFKDMQGRKKGQAAQLGNQEVLKELAAGGDERYSACVDSVKSSERYIDWLSQAKFTGFSDQDRKEHTEYLTRQSVVCSKCALEMREVKSKFQQPLQGEVKPSRSLIHTLVLEYLQTVFNQLKAQRSIFKREVDLGDWFANATQGFFTSQFSNVRSKPNPSAIRAIARALAILKENQIAVPDMQSQQDVKAIDKSIHQLQEKLEKRRNQYEELNSILSFLSEVIEDLQMNQPAANGEETQLNSTRRMAFTSRKGNSSRNR